MSEEPARRYETVNLYRTGAAAKIVLNRPERMNAWSSAMSRDLLTALREVAADDAVRAVMLTGAGRAFCSGADLKEGAQNRADGDVPLDTDGTLTGWYHPIVTTIREMPKPVISAVNGPAAGAGLSLALSADLVVAKESAYFLLAFVNIGLVPDGGSSFLIPERIGFARAIQMAMLGDKVPAKQAHEWGLINRVVPNEQLAEQTAELADRLASGPTRSYAGSKRQLNQWAFNRMHEQLELEATIQAEMARTPDFIEGVTAFVEKRPANFTGH